MKPHHIKAPVFAALFIALIATLSIHACKKPTDGINIQVSTSTLEKSPVMIHFANANPSSTTVPGSFTVAISGKNANLVQMSTGGTNFTASNGFLPLSLVSTAQPSASNPVTFNVYAEIDGFAPVSQTITITKDTMAVYDITAVEYAHPANGTSVLSTTSNLSGGVSNGATFTIPSNATVPTSVQIIIPAGTQVMDSSSKAINASTLNVSAIDYSATSATSFGAFPGGFSPSNVVDANGNAINGGNGINFISAGLTSINMSASGTPVKHFSKPVQVSMQVDPNVTNFNTGKNIAAGDVVPLWSLNEQTGQWTSEGNVTIAKSGINLVANFQTSHLSCFNLDWSWAIAGQPYGTCNTPLVVKLHGTGIQGTYDVALVTPGNQYLAASHGEFVTDGDVVTFPQVASIAQAKIAITDFNLYLNPALPILAQTALFNPCTQGTIDVNLSGVAQSNVVKTNISLVGKCSNKNINVYPTGWCYLYDYTSFKYTYVYIKNGAIYWQEGLTVSGTNGNYSIDLKVGDHYVLYVWNDGGFYGGDFTVAKQNITLNPAANLGVSGTITYDAVANALNLKGTFNINCK